MNVYIVITVAMVTLLKNLWQYGIIFMDICVYYRFPVILDGRFTSEIII
jgi:hypothetical protein